MTPVVLTTNEKVLVLSSNLLASHSHPVFPYFSHSQLALGLHAFSSTRIYLGYALAMCSSCFSLRKRTYITSQNPSQLLQDNVTKPAFLSLSPSYCYISINHIVLYVLDLPHSLPLSPLRAVLVLSLCPAWYREAQSMCTQVKVFGYDSNS